MKSLNNKNSEFNFIRRLTSGRYNSRNDILTGIGDDAAVVQGHADRCYLFTCDAQVEGRHFFKGADGYGVGRRLASVNLSDIAAMGGTPLYALSSLFVPDEYKSGDFLNAVYDGLYDKLACHGAAVVGGNVSGSDQVLAMDLFLVGDILKSQVLNRSDAVSGQLVCVTGTIGDSAAGFKILSDNSIKQFVQSDGVEFVKASDFLIDRHINPTARIDAGQIIASSGFAGACIDISDGLVQDASHIAKASRVNICINQFDVPLSKEYKLCSNIIDDTLFLHGGEDYELLFTVNEKAFETLKERIFNSTGVMIFAIGKVCKNSNEHTNSVAVYDKSGNQLNLFDSGFDHFKSEDSGKI